MEHLMIDWRSFAGYAIALAYIAMYIIMYRRAHRQIGAPATQQLNCDSGASVMVVYASQTGQAEMIARQAVQQFKAANISASLWRIDQAWLDAIEQAKYVLFIASTYGDGSAPDHAIRFSRNGPEKGPQKRLRGVRYGLLSLGDQAYPQFCAFGHRLDDWLTASGAIPVFPRIDVNRLDPQSLTAWKMALQGLFSGHVELAHSDSHESGSAFTEWRFVRREHLNAGSVGAPIYRIELKPASDELPVWQAGDLVELIPPGGTDKQPRTYSIASIPSDKRLELIVRSYVHEDGRLGLASGWLNHEANPGDSVMLRLRSNPAFHFEASPPSPLILIGAGSGIAGLRAHLKARAETLLPTSRTSPERGAWLFFGERTAQYDNFCAQELESWKESGVLTRLNLSFSRDEPNAPYVQHALHREADGVREWIRQGASVLICGSARGMAQGIDEALRRILGSDLVDELSEIGRIRRDVF